MSIFGKNQDTTTDEVTVDVIEGYTVEVGGDLLALQEAFDDQVSLIQDIHEMDTTEREANQALKALQESGADEEAIAEKMQPYEVAMESALSNAWESIRKFFERMWAKLQSFFKSVMQYLDGKFRSGESFAKKYEDSLKNLTLTGFEYKLFDYTNLETSLDDKAIKDEADKLLAVAVRFATSASNVKEDSSGLKQMLAEKKEQKEEILDVYRGKLVGKGDMSANQFKRALYSYYRGGATDAEDKKPVSITNVATYVAALKDTKARSTAEGVMKKSDDEMKTIIGKIKEISGKVSSAKASTSGEDKTYNTSIGSGDNKKEVSYSKDTKQLALEALRVLTAEYNGMKTVQLQAFRAWREAWAERNSAYKDLLVAAMRHKAPKANGAK